MLAPLKFSVTEAASRLAMWGVALSRVLNCKAAISPDLAVRLEKASVSTARAWLSMQASYDLWQAMQHDSTQSVSGISRAGKETPNGNAT